MLASASRLNAGSTSIDSGSSGDFSSSGFVALIAAVVA
jgi:hypothetical protein